MEFIQSKDNKTIKRIVSLGQRKNRSKYGEYIVEGIHHIYYDFCVALEKLYA